LAIPVPIPIPNRIRITLAMAAPSYGGPSPFRGYLSATFVGAKFLSRRLSNASKHISSEFK